MSRPLPDSEPKSLALQQKFENNNMSDTPWYLYIIEADDGSLYTGITTDVRRRFDEHRISRRGARYFNGRKPLAVRYVEDFADRSSASRREYEIKSLSAQKKRQLIATAEESQKL